MSVAVEDASIPRQVTVRPDLRTIVREMWDYRWTRDPRPLQAALRAWHKTNHRNLPRELRLGIGEAFIGVAICSPRPGRKKGPMHGADALARAIAAAYAKQLAVARRLPIRRRKGKTPSEIAAEATCKASLFAGLRLTPSAVLRARTIAGKRAQK